MQLGQLYSAYTRKKDVPILFFFNLPGFKGSNRLWINFADWKFWKYFELKNKLQTILLIAKLQGNCEWIFTSSCGKLFYGMVICFILLVSFFILPFLNQNAKHINKEVSQISKVSNLKPLSKICLRNYSFSSFEGLVS